MDIAPISARPSRRKLDNAYLATRLLVAAATSDAPSDRRGGAANCSGNKEAASDDGAGPAAAPVTAEQQHDVALLPRQIRVRYQEILLEWAITALSKSAAGKVSGARRDGSLKAAGGKHAAGQGVLPAGTAGVDMHADPRAWRLLHSLLQARATASGAMLSESLLSAMAATCSGLQAHPDAGRSNCVPCPWYGRGSVHGPCSALLGRAAFGGSKVLTRVLAKLPQTGCNGH